MSRQHVQRKQTPQSPQKPQATPPRVQSSQPAQTRRLFVRMFEQMAGWCQPIERGMWHYFQAGDALSLCGRWLYSGAAREDTDHDRDDTCNECRERRSMIEQGWI